MKWTKESPKQTGYYWLNKEKCNIVVHITIDDSDHLYSYISLFTDAQKVCLKDLIDIQKYKWFGPLEVPK